MIRGDRDQDTICAVSTPHGVGGISVVRLSGPQAFSLVRKLAPFLPDSPESHKVYFGTFSNQDHSQKIDEVLLTTFHQGRSFTGDETVEISCHGSPVIASWILQELISVGARAADRGEFTYRAFMNGKVDLVQAESVLSLIESQSQKSAQQALSQLKGSLSEKLNKAEEDLMWCLARLEVSIDFSTEDVEIVSVQELTEKTKSAQSIINKLLSTYQSGKIIHDGIQIVLVGKPNVGKSSLLNLFSGEEKAIVTEIAGTTRDLIESDIIYKGYKIKFIDTAGLHDSDNKVEKIGIEKTKKTLPKADIVFFIYDLHTGFQKADAELLDLLSPQKTLIIGNKSDLLKQDLNLFRDQVLLEIKKSNFYRNNQDFHGVIAENMHFISTTDEKYLQPIYNFIDSFIEKTSFEDQALIFQSRHFENLSKVSENLDRALMLFQTGASAEFGSLELKEALLLIHETLGKRFDDQIMDRVFKDFCIGK